MIFGRLGEHAEVEHCAFATWVVDDDVGVVENVADLTVVDLVEVVHGLVAGRVHLYRTVVHDQVHEVEVVTRLLDEGAAGVAAEAIPIAHLGEEWEAVLADRHHLHVTDKPCFDLGDEGLDRGHVAIFESDPDHTVIPLAEAD